MEKDSALYNRSQKVFVINAPATGTAVDTYTKMEIDFGFSAMGNRVTGLATAIEDIRKVCHSDINKQWLGHQLELISARLQAIESAQLKMTDLESKIQLMQQTFQEAMCVDEEEGKENALQELE